MLNSSHQSTAGSIWKSTYILPVVCFFFLLSRLDILIAETIPGSSDVPIYANYMIEQELANRAGESIYEFHASHYQRMIQKRAELGLSNSAIAARENIEYPPLAMAFLRLPTIVINPLPEKLEPEKKLPWFILTPEQQYIENYTLNYPFWLATADAVLFVLVLVFQRRLFPDAGNGQRALLLALYVLSTTILWLLLYSRLDLILVLLMTAALFLLLSRVHYLLSFAVLAVAINFKMIPLILAPIWLVGSLPVEAGSSLLRPKTLFSLVVRVVLLLGMAAVLFLAFFHLYGPGTLGFVVYHKERGLEVDSLYSLLLMLLSYLGHPIEIVRSHGSFCLQSSLSPLLSSLAPVLAGAALLAAAGWFLLCLRRRSNSQSSPLLPHDTLAQNNPALIIQFTLLFLTLFMATNKVFSPQYMLWLAPFFCLLSWRDWPQRISAILYIAACGATTILFPFYYREVVGIEVFDAGITRRTGPSIVGVLLLLLRNGLIIGLIASLIWGIVRDMRNRESPFGWART